MHLRTAFTSLTLAALAASAALAETPNSFPQPLAAPFGGYRHASTIAEGALRGQADLIRGIGEYNYNTAAAWLIGEHAYSKQLDNEVQRVHTFFQKRQLHDQYIAESRPQRPSPEQARELAQAGLPDRLDPSQLNQQLGAIYWPALLEQAEFAPYRLQLEALFEARAPGNSGLGSVNYRQIKLAAEQMTRVLRSRISKIDPSEYVQAKKFIASMAYDARFPLELGEEVAANAN